MVSVSWLTEPIIPIDYKIFFIVAVHLIEKVQLQVYAARWPYKSRACIHNPPFPSYLTNGPNKLECLSVASLFNLL